MVILLIFFIFTSWTLNTGMFTPGLICNVVEALGYIYSKLFYKKLFRKD
jgi:hypothetical protein